MPYRQGLPLLQYIVIPLRVRPPIPPVDQSRRRVAVPVNYAAVGFRQFGRRGRGVVHHIEQAHLPLPLRPHLPENPNLPQNRRKQAYG